ncbi:MAG: LicD family protein [Clostridia bacterium]|nr:LicD family protein [Clostridia bacterium]
MAYLTLNEVHTALLGILTEFDRVCREHDLKYSLAYGTLIGAIRHKGFIPWDDDVDVVMPRPDYEKFYALVKEGMITFSEHFLLSEDRGKKALYPFLKLMDDRFSVRSHSHKEVPYLFIDIFPLDGAPTDEKSMEKIYKRRLRYNALNVLALWYTLESKWSVLLRVFGFPVYLFATVYGAHRAAKKARENAQRHAYEAHGDCGVFCYCQAKWKMPRASFEEYIDVPFEDKSFRVIADYDIWLRRIYGDYMQIPPEDKRQTHCVKAFLREEL